MAWGTGEMQSLSTKGKSESVTFRIDSMALKKLRREAEQKDISTNILVNQIIKDHLNWHSNAAKAGFIAVRRPFVTKVINNFSRTRNYFFSRIRCQDHK